MRQDIRRDLSYMTYAPIVFISALTGQRVDRLFDSSTMSMTRHPCALPPACSTPCWLTPPPACSPHRQGTPSEDLLYDPDRYQAPHFVCFCNDAKLFHFSYQRYLENQIRSTFGLEGTPVRLTIRQKSDKEG